MPVAEIRGAHEPDFAVHGAMAAPVSETEVVVVLPVGDIGEGVVFAVSVGFGAPFEFCGGRLRFREGKCERQRGQCG